MTDQRQSAVQPMPSTRIGDGVYEVLGTTHNTEVRRNAEGGERWWTLVSTDLYGAARVVGVFDTKRAALQYCQEHPEL